MRVRLAAQIWALAIRIRQDDLVRRSRANYEDVSEREMKRAVLNEKIL